MGKILDLTGQKFNKLTVLSRDVIKKKMRYWICKCDCGNIISVNSVSLRSSHTKSCGCIKIQSTKETNTKHGMRGTRIYNIWTHIIQRCNNKNRISYKNYGGRGIIVEWNMFEEFRDDMYKSYLEHVEKYGEKETSIDRIDNNGNYCKENCKRSTPKEQSNNRRERTRGYFKKKTLLKFLEPNMQQ